jgi:hypothetical protein
MVIAEIDEQMYFYTVPQGTQRLQESNFVFHLTPQQATDIASSRDLRPGSKMEYVVQVE